MLLKSWLLMVNQYLRHPFIEVDNFSNFAICALKNTGASRLPVGITTAWLACPTVCMCRMF